MEEKKEFIQVEFTKQQVSLLNETIINRVDCLKGLRENACLSGLFSIARYIDDQLELLSDIEYKLDKYDLPF